MDENLLSEIVKRKGYAYTVPHNFANITLETMLDLKTTLFIILCEDKLDDSLKSKYKTIASAVVKYEGLYTLSNMLEFIATIECYDEKSKIDEHLANLRQDFDEHIKRLIYSVKSLTWLSKIIFVNGSQLDETEMLKKNYVLNTFTNIALSKHNRTLLDILITKTHYYREAYDIATSNDPDQVVFNTLCKKYKRHLKLETFITLLNSVEMWHNNNNTDFSLYVFDQAKELFSKQMKLLNL